jgi:hypothetical protein
MAITSLVDGITGVGPTGQFLIGPNTIAPYAGTSVVGLTDGTSAATASKNVAEIYNEIIFDKRIIIEKAGLTFDPADNSQLLRAIQKLPNYSPQSYGTFASVAAPTLAPTEANPKVILTNSNQEVFAWTGTNWALIANGYSENLSGSFTNSTFNSTAIYSTYTAQRAGKIIVETSAIASWASTTPNMYTLAVDSFGFGSISYSLDSTTAGFVKNSATINVSAGQVINAGIYIGAQNNTIAGTGKMTITYIG